MSGDGSPPKIKAHTMKNVPVYHCVSLCLTVYHYVSLCTTYSCQAPGVSILLGLRSHNVSGNDLRLVGLIRCKFPVDLPMTWQMTHGSWPLDHLLFVALISLLYLATFVIMKIEGLLEWLLGIIGNALIFDVCRLPISCRWPLPRHGPTVDFKPSSSFWILHLGSGLGMLTWDLQICFGETNLKT